MQMMIPFQYYKYNKLIMVPTDDNDREKTIPTTQSTVRETRSLAGGRRRSSGRRVSRRQRRVFAIEKRSQRIQTVGGGELNLSDATLQHRVTTYQYRVFESPKSPPSFFCSSVFRYGFQFVTPRDLLLVRACFPGPTGRHDPSNVFGDAKTTVKFCICIQYHCGFRAVRGRVFK